MFAIGVIERIAVKRSESEIVGKARVTRKSLASPSTVVYSSAMSVTIMMRQNHAAGSRRRRFLDTRPCSPFVLLYHLNSRVARVPHTWNETDRVDVSAGIRKRSITYILLYEHIFYRIDTSKIAIAIAIKLRLYTM
ncbi:Uncharacterized protein DBV15_05145 [Temnothorax longispinosus]|uniref:Uncharacterized protein n=1 Tax=Temnothorax longispinosus TaxID=300112 RepID=A0A4S2KUN5_9HYME|nr:Uncharacterized protein DBV15_05145 [Temnothorax longispinosus]